MPNPSLQEIDEQFDKEFPLIEIVGENEADGTFVLEKDREKVKSFIHKVIAERDEALRKEILSLPLYKNSSKAIPKGEVVVQLSAISSLLSKE